MSAPVNNVGIIGLGSMGMGAAQSCIRAGLNTWGADLNPQALETLRKAGARDAQPSAAAFAGELEAVVLLVVNAAQVNAILFGEEGLAAAKRITESLFNGDLAALSEEDFAQLAQDGVPMVEMEKGADLMQALVDSELQPSRGQARKTIASNAVTVNGEKQTDAEYVFTDADRLFGRYTLLRRGKKNYCLVCWK